MLLRSTSIHSSKLRYIAESLPQSRILCDVLGSDALCAIRCINMGHRGGYCNNKKVCICR